MEVMVMTDLVTRMPVVVILCMTEDHLTQELEVGIWEVRDP